MSESTCTVEGCEKPIAVKARGVCGMHYGRMVRAGEIEKAGKLKVRQTGPCTVESCEKPSAIRGLCHMHDQRKRRHGTTDETPRGAKGPCMVDGCDEPSKTRRLCSKHYQRMIRHGDTADFPGVHIGHVVCSVEGCEKKHKAHGYCSTHDSRIKLGIPLDAPPLKTSTDGTCEGPECDDPIQAKRLCAGHYAQQRAGLPLTPKQTYEPKGGPCSVAACDRTAVVAGMCQSHRVRWRRGDEGWDAPIPDKAPNGTGYINKDGYRQITVGGKQTLEHRWLAGEALARPLTKQEQVHHLNGSRADNRIDGPFVLNHRGQYVSGNLEIWSTSQPAGQEIGPKVEWAVELLSLYGDALTEPMVARLAEIVERAQA